MFKDLQNRNVIITGAAQGLGLSMAMEFSRVGSKVCLIDLDQESLDEAQRTIEKETQHASIQTAVCDISKPDQVQALSNLECDVLINNAGILRDASLFKMTLSQWQSVMDVHLTGTFLMTQLFGAKMKEQKNGSIINLSSVASQGNFGQTNYAAAKAGIIGMTKTWALELSRYNIRVNAIAPGLIETQMTQSIPQDIRDAMVKKILLQRMGTPLEIANLACFLASNASSYIQGQTIHINGGYFL